MFNLHTRYRVRIMFSQPASHCTAWHVKQETTGQKIFLSNLYHSYSFTLTNLSNLHSDFDILINFVNELCWQAGHSKVLLCMWTDWTVEENLILNFFFSYKCRNGKFKIYWTTIFCKNRFEITPLQDFPVPSLQSLAHTIVD